MVRIIEQEKNTKITILVQSLSFYKILGLGELGGLEIQKKNKTSSKLFPLNTSYRVSNTNH